MIGVVSKGAQIVSIREARTSDSVSYCFYIINIISSSMRVYTNLIRPSWELLVIINLILGMLANASVCVTIYSYRTNQEETKKKD